MTKMRFLPPSVPYKAAGIKNGPAVAGGLFRGRGGAENGLGRGVWMALAIACAPGGLLAVALWRLLRCRHRQFVRERRSGVFGYACLGCGRWRAAPWWNGPDSTVPMKARTAGDVLDGLGQEAVCK